MAAWQLTHLGSKGGGVDFAYTGDDKQSKLGAMRFGSSNVTFAAGRTAMGGSQTTSDSGSGTVPTARPPRSRIRRRTRPPIPVRAFRAARAAFPRRRPRYRTRRPTPVRAFRAARTAFPRRRRVRRPVQPPIPIRTARAAFPRRRRARRPVQPPVPIRTARAASPRRRRARRRVRPPIPIQAALREGKSLRDAAYRAVGHCCRHGRHGDCRVAVCVQPAF